MKNFLKYVAALAIVGAFFVACSDWTDPEREITQHPDQQSPILRDNAYYQALREYKKTKHKIAFGWYGSWTAVGASYQTRLQSAPDSMDIISIWSQWHSLTPEQIADKEFVQKIKGTKVTFTIFSDKMPEPFLTEIGGGEYTDEAIEAYAKAYCKDSMDKYSYDGIDVDYEPGYGASGPFVGHDNELFRKLILAMSKYVALPTGRLLMIDGVPYAVHADVADCFDYGIVQAYNPHGYRFAVIASTMPIRKAGSPSSISSPRTSSPSGKPAACRMNAATASGSTRCWAWRASTPRRVSAPVSVPITWSMSTPIRRCLTSICARRSRM